MGLLSVQQPRQRSAVNGQQPNAASCAGFDFKESTLKERIFSMLNLDASLIYRIPALLFTITVHEYAHGAMSSSLGDPTPEADGRLIMNPLAHLDLIGSLMLLLVGFGWAKPVRVDPRYYPDMRKGMLQVAFAGPGSNLFVTFLAMLLQLVFARYFNAGRGVLLFLNWLMLYNVWFAFFNLLPIPPMDGYNVLRTLLPYDKAAAYERLVGPYVNLILIVLCFTGVVSVVITPLSTLYLRLCRAILSLVLF